MAPILAIGRVDGNSTMRRDRTGEPAQSNPVLECQTAAAPPACTPGQDVRRGVAPVTRCATATGVFVGVQKHIIEHDLYVKVQEHINRLDRARLSAFNGTFAWRSFTPHFSKT